MKKPAKIQFLLNLYYADNPKEKLSKNLIVHKILANGDFPELEWLFKNYSKQEIRNVFIKNPSKEYTSLDFNFVKNTLLDLKNVFLQREKYVVYEYRRPQTHL